MKKIPTAYKRIFEGHKIIEVIPEFTSPECEKAVISGRATIKIDGACCMLWGHRIFKRYDFKPGRTLPEGAIPCQAEPDPITGHFPHWVKCRNDNPADKWFIAAFENYYINHVWHPGDTFEAIGEHFNGNPYNLKGDYLIPHGIYEINVERNFEAIREYLEKNNIEGIVFWYNRRPVCKIKRSDFGFPWGCSK